LAISPNVWVKYRGDETHGRRGIRVRMRELKGRFEYAAFIKRSLRADKANQPIKNVVAIHADGKTIMSNPGAQSFKLSP
jgi:hypothetical protein